MTENFSITALFLSCGSVIQFQRKEIAAMLILFPTRTFCSDLSAK